MPARDEVRRIAANIAIAGATEAVLTLKLFAFCCCATAIAVRKASSVGTVFAGSRFNKISPRARWVSASFQRCPVRSVRATA